MKIVIMTPHLTGKGGTETVIKKFINNMKKNNSYEIRLIIDGGSDDCQWLKGISKVNVFAHKSNILKLWYAFFSFLFSGEDAFILIDTRLIFIASLVKKIFQKKYKIISWIHFSVFNSTSVKVKYLKYADYHFAISSGIASQMETLGINKNKIYTVFNPVSKSDKLIKRTNPDKPKKLIYVGRVQFVHQKNLKLLLDTLSILTKPWSLDVYGDGEDLEKCKKYANSLNISNKIHWYGWTSEPWTKIKVADVLLLSSNYEGFPMIILEALAHGLPCISSDCPTGPRDIIKNNINGFLFRPGEVNEMKLKIDKILNNEFDVNPNEIAQSADKFYDEQYFSRINFFLKNQIFNEEN